MSIKVEDLRVGNSIYEYSYDFHEDNKFIDKDSKEVVKVNLEILKEIEDNSPLYEPILLTDKDVKQYGHFNLIKVNEDYFVCFGNYKTQIKWMHELQNYYYLVNHEEL